MHLALTDHFSAEKAAELYGLDGWGNGYLAIREDGHLVVPDRPGWGTEPNEAAIRAHPPRGKAGLVDHGRKG